MKNKILDLKIAFYKQAMKLAPKMFAGKYQRNCNKRKGLQKSFRYQYISHYEPNQDFSHLTTDIKTIAYYLPQFHTFPENDAWWGKGFTEWTNTRPAKPRGPGHYQPRVPHEDIGYYDLSDVRVMAKQAKLAKEHGIYGFCMYYYWFSGKKLMEKPLDNLLAHPEIDFPFCLCWANENWSRRWDGSETDILIEQKHLPEDPLLFIKDLAPYLKDKRYIRVNGKPIVLVYNLIQIPNPAQTFEIWRKYCRENGIGEIEIWGVRACIPSYSYSHGNLVDREVEFPPHLTCNYAHVKQIITAKHDLLAGYQNVVNEVINPSQKGGEPITDKPIIRAAMIGWDNTARHAKNSARIYNEFSLYAYYQWLRFLVDYTRGNMPKEERFMFINAWNEWAEGTYLEPDEKYGYASINVTSRAIFDLPFEPAFPENSVLIACLESLGDIVACEPVIAAVQKKYPNRPIYWVTSVQYAELLEAHPALAGVIPLYTMEQWQNLKKALPATAEVVDLHFKSRSYYLSQCVRFYNNNRTDITDENYYNCGKSLLDIFSQVAGLPSDNSAPKFYLSPRAKKMPGLPKEYVVVHAESAENNRNWTEDKWKKLANYLTSKGIAVVEVGTNAILKGAPGCIDATNLPSLQDTAAVIAGGKLFVGIDSAMAHFANALNIPGVVLLGKYRTFERYMPYSGNYQKGINSCVIYADNGFPAADIPLETVIEKISSFL